MKTKNVFCFFAESRRIGGLPAGRQGLGVVERVKS